MTPENIAFGVGFVVVMGCLCMLGRGERARSRRRDQELNDELRPLFAASHVLVHDDEGQPCGFMPIRTVELRMAFAFTCEECGRDSFVRGIVPESLEGQIPEDVDLGDFDGGEWVMRPERVTCGHCGLMFAVEG